GVCAQNGDRRGHALRSGGNNDGAVVDRRVIRPGLGGAVDRVVAHRDVLAGDAIEQEGHVGGLIGAGLLHRDVAGGDGQLVVVHDDADGLGAGYARIHGVGQVEEEIQIAGVGLIVDGGGGDEARRL